MSIIQSKQTSKNHQKEQQLEQEPHRHPMVHTKQTLTNQLKQQLERESHRQPTLQTELKREWERAYKELLMVAFIFFPKLDFARSSSLGFAGSSSLGRNTTGGEIANDVERAPPDNMSDAEREIRTLLGIRGLKQTQINMCQVALEEWQSIGQYYTKRVNETQAEVRSVRNELYQLLLSYSAFQGLLITAVGQSSLLQCHNVGFPLALSALATAGVAIGMAQKNMLIGHLKRMKLVEDPV